MALIDPDGAKDDLGVESAGEQSTPGSYLFSS